MNIQLTPQQQQELDTHGGELPRLIDPRTNAIYVLISEPEYEAFRRDSEEKRQQQGIRAVSLRNVASRKEEAICRNPLKTPSLWNRVFNSHPACLNPARIRFLDAKVVFYDWERLRLVLNLILFGLAICRLSLAGFNRHPHWSLSLLGAALVVNICFCALPVVEGYLCWFGLDRYRARWMAFLLGTIPGLLVVLSSRLDELFGAAVL
jgi:hypothetical protein